MSGDEELRVLERQALESPGDVVLAQRLARARRRAAPPERTVILREPLEHQIPIVLDEHRFKVLDAGRQWGKTLLGEMCALDGHGPTQPDGLPLWKGALHGREIWWVTKDFPTSNKIWRDVNRALARWGGELKKNKVEKRIEFPGGGALTIKSAHDPDSVRGETLDGVVGDESAFWAPEVWGNLLPTLLRREGWGLLISSPDGYNWFYDTWLLGVDFAGKREPDHASWKRPTSDNPTISPAEIERMRRRMGELRFQRECLAEFDVKAGGMFRREWFRLYETDGDFFRPLPHACWCAAQDRASCERCKGAGTIPAGEPAHAKNVHVFLTADLAATVKRWSDFTVVVAWAKAQDGTLYALDLFRGKVEVPALTPLLRRLYDEWGAKEIWMEDSGPLVRVNHEARDAGMNVLDVPVGDRDKAIRASPAAPAVEHGRVLLPRGAPWVHEFVSECSAFPDPSVKDDTVDNLQLAVRAYPAPYSGPPARRREEAWRNPSRRGGSQWD